MFSLTTVQKQCSQPIDRNFEVKQSFLLNCLCQARYPSDDQLTNQLVHRERVLLRWVLDLNFLNQWPWVLCIYWHSIIFLREAVGYLPFNCCQSSSCTPDSKRSSDTHPMHCVLSFHLHGNTFCVDFLKYQWVQVICGLWLLAGVKSRNNCLIQGEDYVDPCLSSSSFSFNS